MEDKETIVDQAPLAEAVASKIEFDFFDFFLVKPLDPVKVKKTITKPVSIDNKPTVDANGIEAVDYNSVETEEKEVDSDYRRGIVIKRPLFYTNRIENPTPEYKPTENEIINVGDLVIFRDSAGLPFDQVRDSRLLRQFDIVGVKK